MALTLTTDPELPPYPLPGSPPAEDGEPGQHLAALDELRGEAEFALIAAEESVLAAERAQCDAAVRLAEREVTACRRRLAAIAHAVALIEGKTA